MIKLSGFGPQASAAVWRFPSRFIRLGVISAASLAIGALAGPASADGLSNPTAAELDDIASHLYQGSPYRTDHSCGTRCESLTQAEQDATVPGLNNELLRLRAAIGIMPSFTEIGEISLTPSRTEGAWRVNGPGTRTIYHSLKLPASLPSTAFWSPSYQRIAPFAAGDSILGIVSVPEDGWSWLYGYSSDRNYDVASCPNHAGLAYAQPADYVDIGDGGSVLCRDSTVSRTHYTLRPSDEVISTPRQAATVEVIKVSNAPPDPGYSLTRSRAAAELATDRYPVLNVWYDWMLEKPGSCDPEAPTRCRVPPCRDMSVPDCETLLDQREFANHTVVVNSGASVDLGVAADLVTGTSPAAGSVVDKSVSVEIRQNPATAAWQASLLERYAPELVYDDDEAFRADAAAMLTDWPENVLERQNGEDVGPPTLSLDFLGGSYTDGQLSSPSDLINAGPEGINGSTSFEEVEHSIAAAELRTADPATYANKAYGRIVADSIDGNVWVQYWLYYYYNPSPPSFFDTAAHEGDWEMVQFAFQGSLASGLSGPIGPLGPEPHTVAAAAHDAGNRCPWSGVERAESGAPRVYVALDSHATYFDKGTFGGAPTVAGQPIAFTDTVGGEGERIRPESVSLDSQLGWVQWPGRWGGTEGIEPLPDSPVGPAFQGLKWSNPGAWADTVEVGGGCRTTGTSSSASSSTSEADGVRLVASGRREGGEIKVEYQAVPRTDPVSGIRVLATRAFGASGPVLKFQRTPRSRESGGLRLPVPPGTGPIDVRVTAYSSKVSELTSETFRVPSP